MQPTGSSRDSEGCRDCGSFFIDATGAFGRPDIIVRWSNRHRLPDHRIDRLIEQTWKEEISAAGKIGRELFDGNLCRLVDWSAADGKMSLTLGPTSFKEFIGTNARHPDLHFRHGPEALANPVGVSAALVSTDGFILLGRRSERVAVYPGRIHPIGGVMDYADRQTATPDPFEAMLAEVTEETGLAGESVRGIFCLGMVRDKLTLQPELVFEVTSACDVQAILAYSGVAADAEEHSELLPVGNNSSAVVAFIERNCTEMTPLATAALLLHGLHCWGCGWFAGTRGYLSRMAQGQGIASGPARDSV